MAQVPKIYAATPAQTVAAARGMPVSKVASMDHTIDEANRSNIASFEEEFVLREESPQDTSTKNQPQRHLPYHNGRLLISTHFFTTLMDYMQTSNLGNVETEEGYQPIEKKISNAIRIYETNAKVIYGNPDVTGTQLSIRL